MEGDKGKAENGGRFSVIGELTGIVRGLPWR